MSDTNNEYIKDTENTMNEEKLENITRILLRKFRELDVKSDSKASTPQQKKAIIEALKGVDFK